MIAQDTFNLTILSQNLVLLPEKAMFWEEEKGLIISDVHLGKAGHFRKNGIALPQSSNDENLKIIDCLIEKWKPRWILFLGDLFHSEKNEEWDTFANWRASHNNLSVILVMGNHELYPKENYTALGIECVREFKKGPFLMIHDESQSTSNENRFLISGHIHPAVRLKGKGRQSIRIPCFYIEQHKAILPAFGKLTGTFTLKPTKNSEIFGVIDNKIFQIQ